MNNQELPSSVIQKRQRLLEQAKEASQGPGVYLMKNSDGLILYVGKAKNLKNRLSSYFQKIPHETPRTHLMLMGVEYFEVLLTETESEALILECTLIKKHKPRFNVRLKDDKTYPYIKIGVDHPYPKLQWVRRVLKDQARYYGPFPSGYLARVMMEYLSKRYLLRDCSDNTFNHRSRPCMLYQIEQCSAPCVGLVTKTQYQEQLEQVQAVLEGKDIKISGEFEELMKAAAEEEDYEQAAFYRDQLLSLKSLSATQVMDEAGSQRSRDVVGFASGELSTQMVLIQVRKGRVVSMKHFSFISQEQDRFELWSALSQYYSELKKDVDETDSALLMPEEVLIQNEWVHATDEDLRGGLQEEMDCFERSFNVSVKVAESPFEKQLLSVAATNALYALEQSLKKDEGHGMEALVEIQKQLHLAKLPLRIECYDNSNLQGEDAVASRVVFVEGAPDKSLYRRYKVRTVEGANDFATMREILGRRFGKSDDPFPDLVVVDGGKGQLSQALAIFEELGIKDVALVGLAKARTESDFQAKEVKSSFERIFIPGRMNPIPLKPHMKSYQLLTHIRDEAHRFAITYHRKIRDKRSLGQ
jgi:excinuclease ABC subunit C